MAKVKDTKDKFARFKDSEWFGTPLSVVIGGVGGIGSWFAVLLSRTGEHTLALYDMDTVEATNMAGQFYTEADIGSEKVNAVRNHIMTMSGNDCKVFATNSKIDENTPGEPIMVSCFDNMKARKDMFNAWKKLETDQPKLFIDGRMNAENYQMFFVTPERIEEYEKHLFSDDDIEDLPCTYKATSHTAAMLAAKMVTGLTNWISNVKSGKEIRSIPFKYDYDMQFLMETVYEHDETGNKDSSTSGVEANASASE